MRHGRTRKDAKKAKKVNKRLVQQTLRGYGRVNRFTDVEERALAARLTPEAARARGSSSCVRRGNKVARVPAEI